MQSHPAPDDPALHDPAAAALDRLAPTAHSRPRLRVGVGAAVVLLLLAVVLAIIVSAIGQQAGQRLVESGTQTLPTGAFGDSPTPPGSTAGGVGLGGDSSTAIFVHVLGAVARPGLFELGAGARVMDAVAAAGGLTQEADPAGINLARVVSDGEQFYVPRVGEVPPPLSGAQAETPGANGATAPVNLNTATVSDLDSLPRIGPTMAQRIIDYRATNGRFSSIDGLRDVAGIGDKTFDALKDLITV